MSTPPGIAQVLQRVTYSSNVRSRAGWVYHWEFWLALATAAILRLWHLEMSEFLGDQVGVLSIGRLSVVRRALPLTGIQFSIGTFSPPLNVFFTIPFQIGSKDVFPAIVSLALLNVVAVGVCYIFALRYFSRPVAAIASLLYATNNAAIHYSSFQWGPNYIAPFAGLWALALFAGCVEDARRWFVPAGILFAIMVILHPITVLLGPAFIVGAVFSQHKPTIKQCLIVALTCVVMVLPTALFEVLSNFADLRVLAHFIHQPSHIDGQWFDSFLQALGVSSFSGLSSGFGMAAPNPTSAFDRLRWMHSIFEPAAALLFLAGYVMLTASVVTPTIASWRDSRGNHGWRRWQQVAARYVMSIRASRRLRAYLVLWVWVTVPPLALIRHSSPVLVHYFLDLYPATFVISGLAVLWPFKWIQKQSWITSGFGRALQRRGYLLARTAIIGVVGTVVALQGLSWGLYASALAHGQFRVDAGFGYPLGELQAADRALASLQRRLGATVVLISNPWTYQAPSIQNVLASEQSSRTAFSGECLLLPPPSAPAALVVTTKADSDAARFLQAFLAPARVDSIRMPGGDPFEVYRLRVPLGMLPGERVLAGAVFSDASGARLRLESWARDDAGKLRLRWRVLSASPAGVDPVWYRIVLHAYDKTATRTPVPTSSSCEPTQWQAGETLFTWTDIAPAGGQRQIALDRDVMLAPVAAVQVLPYVLSRWEPHVGPLRTESIMVVERSLPPLAVRMDKGTVETDQYPLPAGALTP